MIDYDNYTEVVPMLTWAPGGPGLMRVTRDGDTGTPKVHWNANRQGVKR